MTKSQRGEPANPFIVTGSIPPRYFCDRVAESHRLTDELVNGNNLLLISLRRMGKTGLIRHCYESSELARCYHTLYIDILQTTSLREFTYLLGREVLRRIGSGLSRQLKRLGALLRSLSASMSIDPITGLPTFDLQLGSIVNPELTLDEIFRFLEQAERPVIVAIDEFQQITAYKEANVEAMLRSHIQQAVNARFIFAGSERHILQQMFTDTARPFYDSASVMELGPIARDEYGVFATTLFAERDKSLEPKAVDMVYNLFDCNTFYLQRIFNMAFAMTPAGGTCTVTTVTAAIADLLSSLDTLYRETLSRVNDSQKQLLIAVAEEGRATEITSAAFVRRHTLPSASAVQAASKKLLVMNILSRSAACYSVRDPLLRLWLLMTYGNFSDSLDHLMASLASQG